MAELNGVKAKFNGLLRGARRAAASQHNHGGGGDSSVQQIGQRSAALQHGALLEATLAGDFTGVNAGRLVEP